MDIDSHLRTIAIWRPEESRLLSGALISLSSDLLVP